jgi:hypothetical protein
VEKRVHFLRREEREGEEAQIPRDFELREREQQQDWVGMHPKEGIGKHPRGISAFSSFVRTTAEGGIRTAFIVVCTAEKGHENRGSQFCYSLARFSRYSAEGIHTAEDCTALSSLGTYFEGRTAAFLLYMTIQLHRN